MINDTRLRALAREQDVPAGLAEKNYVNSWILYALYSSPLADTLVFKGGTALSKVYFPSIWRFSEDLDFTATIDVAAFRDRATAALNAVEPEAGVSFTIKQVYTAGDPPEYVRVAVQYDAVLEQRNTAQLDVTLDEPLAFPPVEHEHAFEDVPVFTLSVYDINEVFVEKLRTLYQKPRARHYYDIYRLLDQETFDEREIVAAFREKCRVRGLEPDLSAGLPQEQVEEVREYWQRALDRLVREKPPFDAVVERIDEYLKRLASL